jgi:hypothetical protein
MLVTFATCWYPLAAKFPVETYLPWIRFMLQEVNTYYLVLFTDAAGEAFLRASLPQAYLANPNIKIVQKPCEEWYNYKYKTNWEKNHTKNSLLNKRTEWKVNMLWAEKTHFVNDARLKQYFPPTEFYGWCDIGYFRDGPCPTFANPAKVQVLNKNKIYYACVDPNQLQRLQVSVLQKNAHGLPIVPIPPEQVSIAGGFFIAHHAKIESWKNIFDAKLALYFQHDYLVKDDQIIILDCILTEPQRFALLGASPHTPLGASPHTPLLTGQSESPWFYFRRFLG